MVEERTKHVPDYSSEQTITSRHATGHSKTIDETHPKHLKESFKFRSRSW